MRPRIPDSEFVARQRKTQQLVAARGLDALLVHSNEADFANVRYLSDYWPLFESAGVFVPAKGPLILLIGPESETFARSRTKIKEVRKLIEYREPAEPDYPGIQVSTFRSVFGEVMDCEPRRIGLAGWAILPLPVYLGLKEAFSSAEIVKADDIIFSQRAVKSENEIACLRESLRLSELAIEEICRRVKPGMTELQLAGIAEEVIYREGAEYEGLPQYVLGAEASSHAIGRASYRVLRKGDVVQLNTSSRIHGYSGSMGVPICLGKRSDAVKRLLDFGLKAHNFSRTLAIAGRPANEVAIEYGKFVRRRGFRGYMLYGPYHGLGLIEVERPWIEETSEYALQPNMTFQIDTFFYTPEGSDLAAANGAAFGCRWENGCRITAGGQMPELLGTDLTAWADRVEIPV
jgi:Xaa-Pro aminopeptidase